MSASHSRQLPGVKYTPKFLTIIREASPLLALIFYAVCLPFPIIHFPSFSDGMFEADEFILPPRGDPYL